MNTTRGLITPNLDKLANAGVILKQYYVQVRACCRIQYNVFMYCCPARHRRPRVPSPDAYMHGCLLACTVTQPICSPTRSALMTGRYTVQLGTQSSVIFWDTPWGIDVNETFITNNLKSVGYNTGMFGKWSVPCTYQPQRFTRDNSKTLDLRCED